MGRGTQQKLGKELILPLVIWNNKEPIDHWISCVAVTPDTKHIVSGSWDGNICIWDLELSNMEIPIVPRWISTAHRSSISCIVAANTFFLSASSDGEISYFQLPSGDQFMSKIDTNHLLSSMALLQGDDRVLCCGFFPYILVRDSFTLSILIFLKSSLESDWISWLRPFGSTIQAMTMNGVLKTWALEDIGKENVLYESSSGKLVDGICRTVAFSSAKRLMLVVTTSEITVFDSRINSVFKHDSPNELIEGGDFIGETIIWWTKNGVLYSARDLQDKSSVEMIYENKFLELSVAGNKLLRVKDKYYFICAGFKEIVVHKIDQCQETLNVTVFAVSDVHHMTHANEDFLCSDVTITASCHITQLNKFIAGCSDGSLIVTPATQLLLHHLFKEPKPIFQKLKGHYAAVLCLLHPHSEQSQYTDSLLISGSADFSVCVWDLFKQELIQKFCVQGGPIVRLLTPPAECKSRLTNSVCSISEDHSIALFSLRERRCIFLAACHPFPIVTVRWKPAHDFMIVKCYDGTVFVWELRTGRLDRMITGIAAEEVMFAIDEDDSDELCDFYTKDPPVQDVLQRQLLQVLELSESGPVQIRSLLSSAMCESHVLLFNISSLTHHLKKLTIVPDENEDYLRSLTIPPANSGQTRISIMFDAIKNEAEQLQTRLFVADNSLKKSQVPERKISEQSIHQIILLSQVAASLLHNWQSNEDLKMSLINQGLYESGAILSFSTKCQMGSFTLRLTGLEERTLYDSTALSALLSSFSSLPSYEKLEDFALPEGTQHKMVQSIEQLAGLWLSESQPVRDAARNCLIREMRKLEQQETDKLLYIWQHYLPWPGRKVPTDLSLTGLVLSCLLVSEIGTPQPSIIEQIGNSLKFLLADSHCDVQLRIAAMDLIGRNYSVWEPYVTVDEIIFCLFEENNLSPNPAFRKIGRIALSYITKLKISEVVATLKLICKTPHPVLEKSKEDILHIVRNLFLDKNACLDTIVSDLVELLVTCIDPSYLKSSELLSLISDASHLSQVDHSLVGQRIAVGLPDGKIVIHELRSTSSRCHVFSAHSDAVAGVKFSPDGKLLVTISSSGTASIWQFSHGFLDLGLGQVRSRCLKNFPTIGIVSNITAGRHLKVTWMDPKTVSIEVDNALTNASSTLSTVVSV